MKPPRRTARRVAAAALIAAGTALGVSALAADPPRPAGLRSAFEAQFPKQGASGAALELEELAAGIGIDLAPRKPEPEASSEEGAAPRIQKDDGRARPSADVAKAYEPIGSAAGQFLDREVKTSQEKIGAAAPILERFFLDRGGEMGAIQNVLLREDDVRWEVDASKAAEAPLPNLLGFLRLQKLLLAKALVEARSGRSDEALQSLEASWRYDEAVVARPEVICQLIHIAVAKLQAGVLRKIDGAPYGWAERLRDGRALAAYVAAFENEFWFMQPDAADLTGRAGALGRVFRRIGEEFMKKSLCEWSTETLQTLVEESYANERDSADELEASARVVPNLVDGFLRVRRYEIDAELTALVIDARLEREASRRRHWPAKLLTAGQGVCPERKWSYRLQPNGTALLSFEGKIAESDSPAVRMPFEFVAGKPIAPPRRPPSKKTPPS